MTMPRSRLLAVAALLATVCGLTACGTPRVAAGQSPTAPVAMMPMANEFVSAVMHTRDLGSADVTISARTDLVGANRDLSGVGSVALDRGFGNILWTEAGIRTREINNDVAVFVQKDVPAGIWTRLPDDETTPHTVFADPLVGLGALQDVTASGTEEISGRQTTRYTGRLPADPVSLGAMGLTSDEFAGLGDEWEGASIDVTAWVDAAARLVRVDRSFRLGSPEGSVADVLVSTSLSDFSGVIDVAPPPSASVTEVSPGS